MLKNRVKRLSYISIAGGVVTSGMVVMDTMQMIASPVRTICMGMYASMEAYAKSWNKGQSILTDGDDSSTIIGGIQGRRRASYSQ